MSLIWKNPTSRIALWGINNQPDGVLCVELPRLRIKADDVALRIESATNYAVPLSDKSLLTNLHKPWLTPP
jgi:hypothetical protein